MSGLLSTVSSSSETHNRSPPSAALASLPDTIASETLSLIGLSASVANAALASATPRRWISG